MKEAPAHEALATAEELLMRCGDGDKLAFAELYDHFSSRVYGIALRVVRDAALAEDVAHDAWLNVWDKADTFDRSRGSAAGWVLSIAHRRAVDAVRRSEAARERELGGDGALAGARTRGER